MYRDCQEIHTTNSKFNPNRNQVYGIDPDQLDKLDGGVDIFPARCDFNFIRGIGITNVSTYKI